MKPRSLFEQPGKETFFSKKEGHADVTFETIVLSCIRNPTLYLMFLFLNLEKGDSNSFHETYENLHEIHAKNFSPGDPDPLSPSNGTHQLEN